MVFLNNDTVVTDWWLDALLETFDALPATGVAGSKLRFPNAEMAEEVIKTAESKVSVICAWMVDGVLYEFTGKDEFMPKTG